jgi:hypothetical protein
MVTNIVTREFYILDINVSEIKYKSWNNSHTPIVISFIAFLTTLHHFQCSVTPLFIFLFGVGSLLQN